jgi:hypothetical protein
VYRKEVDMKCTTVSHQIEIEPGICVSIQDILRHQRTLRRDDLSLHDELLEIDLAKNSESYDSLLWKPHQPKDELFLKVQSMSSIEDIEKLYEELNQGEKSSTEPMLLKQPIIKAYDYTCTNKILNKKKHLFEPYAETSEADNKQEQENKKSRQVYIYNEILFRLQFVFI